MIENSYFSGIFGQSPLIEIVVQLPQRRELA
jgi:hypothetical protein